MELLFVYLWLQLTAFKIIFGVSAALLIFSWLIPVIAYADTVYESEKERISSTRFYKTRYTRFVIGVFFSLLATLLPSKTDVAILVGASVAIDLAKSPEGAKVGQLLRGKANELLDQELEELKPKVIPAK